MNLVRFIFAVRNMRKAQRALIANVSIRGAQRKSLHDYVHECEAIVDRLMIEYDKSIQTEAVHDAEGENVDADDFPF